MSRAKSAVLSAADKKAVIVDLKAQIAAAKIDHKSSLTTVKTLNKDLLTAGKAAVVTDKALAKLVASLAAIQAPALNA